MSRIPTLKPRIATLDTRTAKPLPKEADEHYGTPEHRTWALAVKDRAAWRCEHIEDGRRCRRSRADGDRMYADHILEIKDRPDLALDLGNGACKCAEHNVRKGIEARAARLSGRQLRPN